MHTRSRPLFCPIFGLMTVCQHEYWVGKLSPTQYELAPAFMRHAKIIWLVYYFSTCTQMIIILWLHHNLWRDDMPHRLYSTVHFTYNNNHTFHLLLYKGEWLQENGSFRQNGTKMVEWVCVCVHANSKSSSSASTVQRLLHNSQSILMLDATLTPVRARFVLCKIRNSSGAKKRWV